MRRPSVVMVIVLLFVRCLIAFLIIGPLIETLFMIARFGLGPWLIFPIFSAAGCVSWLTQNVLDEGEGLRWKSRLFLIGIGK